VPLVGQGNGGRLPASLDLRSTHPQFRLPNEFSALQDQPLRRFDLLLRSLDTSGEAVEKLPVGFRNRLDHTLRLRSVDRGCLGRSDDIAPNSGSESDYAKPFLRTDEV
jgi:hypothetical protein